MGEDETTNEEGFAHDLMAAGYQKPNSEAENKFLRKYDLSRDDQLSDDKNRVYTNNITGKAYIVYPGTKDWRDVGTDVALFLGLEEKTPRFKRAHEVAKRVNSKYGRGNVTAIGHSLGGSLATASGVQKRITYNKGVGIGGLFQKMKKEQHDYRTAKDIVSVLSLTQRHNKKNDVKYKIWNRGWNELDAHNLNYLYK
jgi:hypothetical protein